MNGQYARLGPPTGTGGRRVAVVGAGAGGTAAAMDLARSGARVTLWDRWTLPGSERLPYRGVLGEGAMPVETGAAELGSVLGEAEVVVVATLASAHGFLVREVVPHLTSSHVVVVACGGAISLALADAGATTSVLGELSCFPYSARFAEDGTTVVRRSRQVRAAALPASATGAFEAALPIDWVGAHTVDVLHSALCNPNYVLHPPAVVMNLASYDRGETVAREGQTPRTQPLVTALDAERQAILAALGYPVDPLPDLMAELESGKRATVPIADEQLLARFVDEDIDVGLGLLAYLAGRCGLRVPVIESIRAVVAAAREPVAPDGVRDLDRELHLLVREGALQ